MPAAQFLSPKVLLRLQTVYEDLPARSKQSGIADQANSALKDFLETSGRAMELSAGEILFRQDDPGEGMYWIESGLLVAADKRFIMPNAAGAGA